jgi:DNA-binding Lrp family transcriptional regulator
VALAFVCITTEPDSMVEVLKKVRAIEGVEQATMVYGIYDIVAKVKRDTINEIKEIIVNRIRQIENVLTTLSIMVVESE